MYDVIVVGTRCGGSVDGAAARSEGYRVLMVDRATSSSDMRLSTHLVWPSGLASLARWGLLDALTATGCPPLAEAVFDLGLLALRGELPPVDGIGHALVPRRRVLDGLLVGAAVATGRAVGGRVGGGAAARPGGGCRHPRTLRRTAGVVHAGRRWSSVRTACGPGSPSWWAHRPTTPGLQCRGRSRQGRSVKQGSRCRARPGVRRVVRGR